MKKLNTILWYLLIMPICLNAQNYGLDPSLATEKKMLEPLAPMVVPKDAKFIEEADGKRIRAFIAKYAGIHQGEHPSWIYNLTIKFSLREIQGDTIWLSEGKACTGDGKVSALYESRFDAKTVRNSFAAFEFPGTGYGRNAKLENNNVVTQTKSRRETKDASLHLKAPVVTLDDDFMTLLSGLKLKKGYTAFARSFDTENNEVRVFRISVVEATKIMVPAGVFPVYTIEVTPTDGNKAAQAVHYVTQSSPHITVKRKYISVPETDNKRGYKKSIASDELVELSFSQTR
jgi:hypothetical protein